MTDYHEIGSGAPDDIPEPPARTMAWWLLRTPEALAVSALTLAFTSLFFIGAAQELVQAIEFSSRGDNTLSTGLVVSAGIRLGVALLAVAMGYASMRSEDEEVPGWSAALARAGVILGSLAALLSAAGLIAGLTVDDNSGF